MVGIIGMLHQILCVQKAFLDFSQESVTVFQLSVHGRHSGLPLLVGNNWRRRTAIDDLKRRSSEGRLK